MTRLKRTLQAQIYFVEKKKKRASMTFKCFGSHKMMMNHGEWVKQGWWSMIVVHTKGNQSLDPTADSDSITNRKHADFNPGVHSQSLVELQHEIPVIPNILPERCIRGCHHRPVPQGVVVPDHTSHFNKLDEPLVVVEVIVLVCIHEDEIEAPMILFLQCTPHTNTQSINQLLMFIPINNKFFSCEWGREKGWKKLTSLTISSRTGRAGPSLKSILWATPAFFITGRPSS